MKISYLFIVLIFSFLVAVPSVFATLTPSSCTSFQTTISDTSKSVLICDPDHTCSSINSSTGASDHCAYSSSGTLVSTSGLIGHGYYDDETAQSYSPCDETKVGDWKVRKYQYSGSFSWVSSAEIFTVTSPTPTPTPSPTVSPTASSSTNFASTTISYGDWLFVNSTLIFLLSFIPIGFFFTVLKPKKQ